MNVTLKLEYREDGGLRVSSPDMRGLILSGEDKHAVMESIVPAIEAIRFHNGTAPVFPAAIRRPS